ncbi:MAG: exonuclease SbcCD subunit D C-terminal domain-containing protein [Candidatus Accumulibacter sp.]|nr:exonuclease SbcCD subunit D C-terminal domain-containing protein [Accumulibacter sp.]
MWRMLTLLHTSDWHLGRALYGRSRDDEFAAFLDWLAETMRRERVDVLEVAGDIFDTTTPTHRAQALYYGFLRRVAAGAVCRHVVIVAGNHDSPSFLDAPGELLSALDVHVVGRKRDDPADEVLLLENADGAAVAIVCAVPYLRDRDLREVEPGESIADKEAKLLQGLCAHYARVAEIAGEKRAGRDIPVVAMGHLFTDGGKTVDGDGVRELYVGSLAHVPAELFPPTLDYLALGHLHLPQTVRGAERIRYSGSPLAMGFAEAAQEKSVCRVVFEGRAPTVTRIPVPVFRRLARVEGDWARIERVLAGLKADGSAWWLEVDYSGEETLGDLRQRVDELVAGTRLEVLRVRASRLTARLIAAQRFEEALEDLGVEDVFERCLDANRIPGAERAELRRAHAEACLALDEEDGARTE